MSEFKLTEEQLAVAVKIRNQLRADKGLPPLEGSTAMPVATQVSSKAVAIAALYILRVSYGQLMGLFQVSQSTVYSAISRHVPQTMRDLRGKGRAKPLIPYEQASLYYTTLASMTPQQSAIILAARIKEATNEANDFLDNESRIG